MNSTPNQPHQTKPKTDVLSSFDVQPVTWPVEPIRLNVVRTVVESFYQTIRDDEILGPIFNEHVADWPSHLATMCEFWSTIVNFTGQYSGNPLAVHASLPHLDGVHFVRWLELWSATVQRCVPAAGCG